MDAPCMACQSSLMIPREQKVNGNSICNKQAISPVMRFQEKPDLFIMSNQDPGFFDAE